MVAGLIWLVLVAYVMAAGMYELCWPAVVRLRVMPIWCRLMAKPWHSLTHCAVSSGVICQGYHVPDRIYLGGGEELKGWSLHGCVCCFDILIQVSLEFTW
jgi:hypothetical protein